MSRAGRCLLLALIAMAALAPQADGYPRLQTHGPDPPAVSVGPLAGPKGGCLLIVLCGGTSPTPTPIPAPTPGPTIACATDNYFQVLLVGNGARSSIDSTKLSRIRAVVLDAGRRLMQGAQESGGKVPRLKFACEGAGLVNVRWGISAPANASFPTVWQAAYNQGWKATNVKYVIFYEGAVSGKCGVSSGKKDDRAGPTNLANGGPEYSMMYSNCWNGPTMLHEVTHAMGAVNPGAPHYYYVTGGHCYDEPDIMCYGPAIRTVCARITIGEHYDCNHDDYFSTRPAAGSYLATHWQVGSPYNRFLLFP